MREIKFRGKLENEWIYGDLVHNDTKICIDDGYGNIFVDENTIGQYTGLKDNNGKEIYEKDIVKCLNSNYNYTNYIVFYSGGAFRLAPTYDCKTLLEYEKNNYRYENSCYRRVSSSLRKKTEEFEVIGNIYDNPELLNK